MPDERFNGNDRVQLVVLLHAGHSGRVDEWNLSGRSEERPGVLQLHYFCGSRRQPRWGAALSTTGDDVSGLQQLSQRWNWQEPLRVQQRWFEYAVGNSEGREGLVRPALWRRWLGVVPRTWRGRFHPLGGESRL